MILSRRSLAIVSIVLLMVVWGSTFVVTKAAAQDISPLMLAALRFLVATAVLVPFAIAKGSFRLLPKPLPIAALSGLALTGVALYTIAFNYALIHGSASQGALVYASMPAAVAIVAVVFLKEKLTQRRIAGITLSMIGIGLVVAGGEPDRGSPQPLLGAAWMLLSVVAWAAYTVLAKRLAGADQLATIAVVSLIGTLMLAPLALIELSQFPWRPPSTQAWLGLVFLGVVASALAYIVYGQALRELDASLVGALINLDPIVGVLTAVLFLGETLHSGQVVGAAIALAGMWLAAR